MSINKDSVNFGDKVKIAYCGLISPEWLEVVEGNYGRKMVRLTTNQSFYFDWPGLEITEHEPKPKPKVILVELPEHGFAQEGNSLGVRKFNYNGNGKVQINEVYGGERLNLFVQDNWATIEDPEEFALTILAWVHRND